MSNSSYTIEKSDIGYSGGRYLSQSPYNAGKKAASQLFRKINNEPKYKSHKALKTIKFTLRETTKGSAKKEFMYKATQKELPNPVIITINGKQIEYKYKIELYSLNIIKNNTHHIHVSPHKGGNQEFPMSGGCGSMAGGSCPV